jgi:hypothetical protein
VKKRADLIVEDVRSELVPDEKGLLYVTYKNVGDEVAEDAVARIMVSDPFSTTDDEAFLGILEPGDSYQAVYSIEVESDALPKTYGIDTEVKYKDRHGDTRISDVITVSATVEEPNEGLISVGYLFAIIIAGVVGVYLHNKRSKEDTR